MIQYRALVKHRKYREGEWCLAIPGERTYKTLEEAYEAIEKVKANKHLKPHWITAKTKDGYIKEWFTDLEIIDSKVESREVTPWTEV